MLKSNFRVRSRSPKAQSIEKTELRRLSIHEPTEISQSATIQMRPRVL